MRFIGNWHFHYIHRSMDYYLKLWEYFRRLVKPRENVNITSYYYGKHLRMIIARKRYTFMVKRDKNVFNWKC